MEEGGGRKGPDKDQMSGDEGKEKRKEEETQQMYTKGTYHFRFFFFFFPAKTLKDNTRSS